eukprot:403073-Prorocentrum_minimum.AAC.1
MASPLLVAGCAAASLASTAAISYYVNEVYGPAHEFERPRTLSAEWLQAEKEFREENMIMGGQYGELGRHIPRQTTMEKKKRASINDDGKLHPATM